MKVIGRQSVEGYLREEMKKGLVLPLFDPPILCTSNITPDEFGDIGYRICERAGAPGVLIGGSTGVTEEMLSKYTRGFKNRVEKPIIIFPGNFSTISEEADAIFFMSLLNSRNPYWIIGAQALAAPIVRRYKLETIPLGYIVVEPGGTVGYIGEARLVPRGKPKIAAGYALAGECLGMRWIYLEAGSGVEEPIPNEMITTVKKVISSDTPLGVGGGLKTPEQVEDKISSGAGFVVVGTACEQRVKKPKELEEFVKELVSAATTV